MSELACNIISYRPDPNVLAEKFRPWQVEALLNQAGTLIDRCLQDFSYYSSLDYAWNQFHADLDIQGKQLDLDRKREAEVSFDRDTLAAQSPENPPEESHEGLEESQEEESKAETGEISTDEGETELQSEPETAGAQLITSSVELLAEAVQRKRDLSAPGQPLALNEQRDHTLRRLCRDYEEALNRACVAEEGLKRFYNHVEVSSPLPSEVESLNTSISNLAIWIRDASEWLVSYQQLEQAFTRVVSVRSLLNRNAWTQLKHTRDSYSTKLQVPADLFRGHENCRLRGISASLVGEAGTVPWSMAIRLPEEAVYERSGQSMQVYQYNLPTCLLGGVENRRSVRPLEIFGMNTLLNASPIGRATPGGFWSVEIFKPAGATSESFTHVEDVLIDIHAVGIPQSTKS